MSILEEHGIYHERSQGAIDHAYLFAKEVHKGEKRKYTEEGKDADDYITHPIAVAKLVATVTNDVNVIIAAILHDVIENTNVTDSTLNNIFDFMICSLVNGMTEFSCLADGNREFRKSLDRRYLSRTIAQVQTIKVADLIVNSKSIIKYDSDFAVTYINEMKLLLEVLTKADKLLMNQANKIIEEYYG